MSYTNYNLRRRRKQQTLSGDSALASSLTTSTVKADGARKIWGMLKTTTCTAVRNTITSVTKLSSSNLQIKRKYKLSRNNPDNVTKWWFVVRDEESVHSKTAV